VEAWADREAVAALAEEAAAAWVEAAAWVVGAAGAEAVEWDVEAKVARVAAVRAGWGRAEEE